MHIVIGNDQLRELGAVVVPLFDVVEPCGFHQVDARLIVQAADELIVVIGKQKLAFNPHQGISQTNVIRLCETVLTDVLIVALRGMIGWVKIE